MSRKKTKLAGGESKKSLLPVIIMLISIVACILAGYTLYELRSAKHLAEGSEQADHEVEPPDPITPVYVPLDHFTVSLKPTATDSDRVLYIGLTLRVKNETSRALIQEFLPEIRSRLLMLFSEHTAEELLTQQGKDQLLVDIKLNSNKPLADGKSAVITDVLLNDFILR